MSSRIRDRLRNIVRREGFTLVEVLVASLLLVLAMAGIVPVFMSALNQSSVVRYKSSATNIAREKMEQIRQLDSREITGVEYLEGRFGTTATQREVSFDISYALEESVYDNGLLKTVTITVDWDGPPSGDGASMSTMIHEQFLGPRVARLAMSNSKNDPLGTPFPLLYPNQAHTLVCYIAEADWALVIDNLNEAGMAVRDGVYARLVLVDSNGQSTALGDPAEDYRISNLAYTTEDGKVTSVYFSYTFNSGDIPDGYWEFRAIAYNEYNEPGNVWRLRTRVENGAPAIPTDYSGIPQTGDESILLVWSGGAERDRAYYILERRKWVDGAWTEWAAINPHLDPNATAYNDQGDAVQQLDPWGSEAGQNWYQYRLKAVDICDPGNVGPEIVVEVAIPVALTTTTTLGTETTVAPTTTSSSTTTTVPPFSSVKVENTTNKGYSLYIEGDNGFTLSSSVGRKSTQIIDSLPAGNYLLTATCAGRPTLKQSFALPQQAGLIVMTIL